MSFHRTPRLSTPRMKSLVKCLQPIAIDVGVVLSRADIRVPEHFLNCSEIRAAGQEVSRK